MATKTEKKAKPTAKPVTAPKMKKGKPLWADREVVYDKVNVEILDGQDGRDLYTVEMAKNLLGWQVEDDAGEKFGDDYTLKDAEGRKVRLTNNTTNRPWYGGNTEAFKQEILFRRWVFNGEPIIITQRGLVGNGQHQSIALIMAEEERLANPKAWKKHWDEPVAIPKMVVFGISDEDHVIDTLDTGKTRSLADILFRGPHFASVKPNLRRVLAKICEGAIRVLWERTGAYKGSEAWSPRRTHGEMMHFLSRHPKVLDAVRHIWEEDEPTKIQTPDGEKSVNPIGSVVRPGMAAALLYLMAAGETKEESGYASKRRESNVDFSLWDKACEYWTLVGKGDDCKGVREAVLSYWDDTTETGATPNQKAAAAILGWHYYLEHGAADDYEQLRIAEGDDHPDCGGIDLGPKMQADEEDDGDLQPADDDEEGTSEEVAEGEPEGGEPVPSEEQVEEGKKKVKAKPKKKLAKPKVDDEPATEEGDE